MAWANRDLERLIEMVEAQSAGVPVDFAHIVVLAERLMRRDPDMGAAFQLIRDRMGPRSAVSADHAA